ncbi:CoA-binding protein [Natrinema gelatinilyticum]|uniref:CoA-binding protein n=1 Tax=Natrinema gelatinilyticum TaxID=2961571 RepID=UPI0020C2B13B|nr:CoA-binding protein [Natrinema gelatinilyticum]
MPVESGDEIVAVLEHDTIAVVGCSSTPGKAAHGVPKYMRRNGYDVIPVNPYADEIFGSTAYDSLADVDEAIDVVCIFRPSEEVGDVVDTALERDEIEAIWTQLGIRDDEAVDRAEAGGKTVVQDYCMKVQHRRLVA